MEAKRKIMQAKIWDYVGKLTFKKDAVEPDSELYLSEIAINIT